MSARATGYLLLLLGCYLTIGCQGWVSQPKELTHQDGQLSVDTASQSTPSSSEPMPDSGQPLNNRRNYPNSANAAKTKPHTQFPAAQKPAGEAVLLVGAWRLVSADFPPEVAEIRGHQPEGMLVYDANGYMAVQLSPGRELPIPERYPLPMAETYEAFLGFVSYYGTYTVDWEKQQVTHQRAFMAPPADVSKPLVRRFELIDNDTLRLLPEESTNRLIWKRLH